MRDPADTGPMEWRIIIKSLYLLVHSFINPQTTIPAILPSCHLCLFPGDYVKIPFPVLTNPGAFLWFTARAKAEMLPKSAGNYSILLKLLNIAQDYSKFLKTASFKQFQTALNRFHAFPLCKT